MLGWLLGRNKENDESNESNELAHISSIPWMVNSEGWWDELGQAMGGSHRVSDDSRQIPLPDGARAMIYRDGRVAADWKRADGTHSKFAAFEAQELRDEAVDRLHKAREWWFGG